MIKLSRIDHLVLTVADLNATCNFYQGVLGMQVVTFGQGRKALTFGNQKINLHVQGHELKPSALKAGVGTADLCFITDTPLREVVEHLRHVGITPETDVMERTGALGPMRSIFLRDPDGNLLEISNYR
jgi:catechol 2,3-dioxygenase-like lactoylglutathione lyase family enzyme